jgi:hypothetical protein
MASLELEITPPACANSDRRKNWRGIRVLTLTRELFAYMGARKKLWLLPILVVVSIFGGLLILAQGSAVAPFIYTIF